MRKSGQTDAYTGAQRFGCQALFREDSARAKRNDNTNGSSRRLRRQSGRSSDATITRLAAKSAIAAAATIGIQLLLAASVTASSSVPSISSNETASTADGSHRRHQLQVAERAAAYGGRPRDRGGNSSSSSSSSDSGGGGGDGGNRRELSGVGAAVNWEGCTSDELWERVVDPTVYKYGCKEIKVTSPYARRLHVVLPFFPLCDFFVSSWAS